MSEWQPRWLAYCRATGAKPHEAWARDGGGARYLVWMQARWEEWAESVGQGAAYRARLASTGAVPLTLGPAEHAAFDAWLDSATTPADASGQIPLVLEAA